MLKYKTETRPGLVALYDIRPENGAGPFLQPRSPHGASDSADNELRNKWQTVNPKTICQKLRYNFSSGKNVHKVMT